MRQLTLIWKRGESYLHSGIVLAGDREGNVLGGSPGARAIIDGDAQGSGLAGSGGIQEGIEAEQHAAIVVVVLACHSSCRHMLTVSLVRCGQA